MSKEHLKKVTDSLPKDLRNDINGYVQSIIDNQELIFKENGILFTNELAGKFIFLVGIRRLIQFVDSQFWTLNNSFSILKTYEVNSVKIGSQSLNKESQYYKDLKKVRSRLFDIVKKYELNNLIMANTLSELLLKLKND